MIRRTFGEYVSKPTIWSSEIVTLGAPFFSRAGCTLAEGIAVGRGVSVGLAVGVSSGIAGADGDALGLRVGDLFLRFRFVSGVRLGDGVGELFLRFGEAVGEGRGRDFLAADFRCLRAGVGVGVASRILLVFVPDDSSALPGATIVQTQITEIRKLRRIILIAADKISAQVPEESLCSGECRLRE